MKYTRLLGKSLSVTKAAEELAGELVSLVALDQVGRKVAEMTGSG